MPMSLRSKRQRPTEMGAGCSFTNETSTSHRLANVQDLPDEMLLSIFFYIPKGDLQSTIPRVCQRWKRLHRDRSLFTYLIFTANQPTDTKQAMELIQISPWLRSLDVSYRNDLQPILREVVLNGHKLDRLVLRKCHGSYGGPFVSPLWLVKIQKQCTQLRHFSLKYTLIYSSEFYRRIGARMRFLQVIDLGSSKLISNLVVTNIARNCHRIEQFRAYPSAKIAGSVIAEFCDRFKDSLRVLKVTCDCTDAMLLSVSRCQHLHTLHLYNADMMSDRLVMLLGDVPNLKYLTLAHVKLVTVEMWSAFFVLPPVRKLQKLTLHMCKNVDDVVAGVVVESLRDLRVLRFMSCAVSKECDARMQRSLQSSCNYWYV